VNKASIVVDTGSGKGGRSCEVTRTIGPQLMPKEENGCKELEKREGLLFDEYRSGVAVL